MITFTRSWRGYAAGTSVSTLADTIEALAVAEGAATYGGVSYPPNSYLDADNRTQALVDAGGNAYATAGVAVSHPGDGTNADAAFLAAATKLQGMSGGVLVIEPGSYIVTNSISLPVNTSIYFKPGAVLLPRAGGTFTGGAIFLLNTIDGTNWVTTYPNQRGAEIINLRVDNSANAALVVGGVISGCPVNLRSLYMSHCHFTVKSTANYMDQFRVLGGYIQESQGSAYQIQLATAGESTRVEDVSFFQTTGVAKAVQLTGCSNGVISGCANGDYRLVNCRAVEIAAMHNETGQILIYGSSVEVRNSYFWELGKPAIKVESGGQRHHISLRNNRHIWMLGQSTTYHDHVEIDSGTSVSVEDCYRQYTKSGSLDVSETMGIGVRDSIGSLVAWNNYAHILSHRGYIGYQKVVQMNHCLTLGSGTLDGVLSAAANSNAGSWTLSTGTYYYTAALLADKPRMLGKSPVGAVQSVALSNGGNGALVISGYSSRVRRGILRLYRGTVSGSYNSYVDVPVATCVYLYDNGTLCNGIPWTARGASAVDSISDVGSGQIEWNGVTAQWAHTAAPTGTVGAFVAGDKQIEIAPAAAGSIGRVCVTAGSPGTWKTFGTIAA